MNQRRVSDATMRVRDVLYDGLRGVLPEEVARERANNLSMSAVEALAQLAEESKPPPVRFPATDEADATARAVPGQDVIGAVPRDERYETTPAGRRYFEDDDTAIGTVRAPKGETAEEHAERIIK